MTKRPEMIHTHRIGNVDAGIMFIQLIDEHDNDFVNSEADILTSLVG